MTTHRSSNAQRKKELFATYLKQLLGEIHNKLKTSENQQEGVVYVLCVEKLIMNTMHMKSRRELLEFVRESEMLDFKANPKQITVVDQGERVVWNSLQKYTMKPPSYYVHAHMTENYIYLKLHQVVDITESNDNNLRKSSRIFIKDAHVTMEDTCQQVSGTIWNYIQSLNNKERRAFILSSGDVRSIDFANHYEIFKEQLTEFIKTKVKHKSANTLPVYRLTNSIHLAIL
jgi:hypothetical protein